MTVVRSKLFTTPDALRQYLGMFDSTRLEPIVNIRMGTVEELGEDCVRLLSDCRTARELVEEQVHKSAQEVFLQPKDRRTKSISDLHTMRLSSHLIGCNTSGTNIAMKCLDELPVLKLLRDCGASFDCASQNEMKKGLSLGVPPEKLIYAHPCKQRSMLAFAKKNGVSLTVFDNEAELYKTADIYPDARLVLRIRIVGPYAGKVDFGTKYGCSSTDVETLLLKAVELKLNVVGISFHVGTNCSDERAFSAAIKQAKDAFDIAKKIGLGLKMLDVGGGFPGNSASDQTFEDICRVMNENLDKYFPAGGGIEVIAEPGRYMVASSVTLCVSVIAKRKVLEKDSEHFSMMYYINDGIYGSFLNKVIDQDTYTPIVMKKHDGLPVYDSSIWGPSCDSQDVVVALTRLPLLDIGDWLYFPDIGAYTLPLSTRFNGMESPKILYSCQRDAWTSLKKGNQDMQCEAEL